MSGIPPLPVAPSIGTSASLPTGNEGGISPVPPIAQFEVGSPAVLKRGFRQGFGILLSIVGDLVNIAADFIGGILPSVVVPVGTSVDWSKGFVFQTTLAAGANVLPAFTNVTDGQTITYRLTSDPGGSTVDWTATGVKWANGTAPTQTPTNTGSDVYTIINDKGGLWGSVVQNIH